MSSERGFVAPLVIAVVAVLIAFVVGGIILINEGGGDEGEPSGDDRYEIRAIGDSVTAGFGHDKDGDPIASPHVLSFCIPPRVPDGRCQSARKVAYPAQFARLRGIPANPPGFRNLAVSGADPADWLDPEVFGDELADVVDDDPDVTMLTLGANPLLTLFLNPAAPRGGLCVLLERPDRVRRCVDAALERHDVVNRLADVYTRLLDTPDDGKRGVVAVVLYHQASPRTVPAAKVGILFGSLREAITKAVASVQAASPENAERLLLVEPPSFANHPCDLEVENQRWVLRSDSCIHPSAEGHRQLAIALDEAIPERAP